MPVTAADVDQRVHRFERCALEEVNKRGRRVSQLAAQTDLLKEAELVRDICVQMAQDSSPEGRKQLVAIFGGTCERIGRLHAVLDAVGTDMESDHVQAPRWSQARDAIFTIEAILKSMRIFRNWTQRLQDVVDLEIGTALPDQAPDSGNANANDLTSLFDLTAKLDDILRRYDVSIADASDLAALYDYEIVVIADDSGSMSLDAAPATQRPAVGQTPTRWQQLQQTLELIMEVGACFDNSGIDLYFLNRGKLPGVKSTTDESFQVAFMLDPEGGTPLTETVRQVVQDADGEKQTLLFILTDGMPDGGEDAFCAELDALVQKRSTSKTFKVQIMACTDDDNSVGYLERLDKALPAIDCTVDYYKERQQVLAAGKVQRFSQGDWCLKALLGAISSKFDQLDEYI